MTKKSNDNENAKLTELAGKIEALSIACAGNAVELKNMKDDIIALNKSVSDLAEVVKQEYTSLDKFEPVKLIAYGCAGGVLLTVLGALLGILLNSHNGSNVLTNSHVQPLDPAYTMQQGLIDNGNGKQ